MSKSLVTLRNLGLLEMERHKNNHVYRINAEYVEVRGLELHVSLHGSGGGRGEG